MPDPAYLTPAQVAAHLSVSLDLVGDLIRRGALPAINVSPPGSKRATYRVSAAALAEYERSRRAVPMPGREVRTRRARRPAVRREYF